MVEWEDKTNTGTHTHTHTHTQPSHFLFSLCMQQPRPTDRLTSDLATDRVRRERVTKAGGYCTNVSHCLRVSGRARGEGTAQPSHHTCMHKVGKRGLEGRVWEVCVDGCRVMGKMETICRAIERASERQPRQLCEQARAYARNKETEKICVTPSLPLSSSSERPTPTLPRDRQMPPLQVLPRPSFIATTDRDQNRRRATRQSSETPTNHHTRPHQTRPEQTAERRGREEGTRDGGRDQTADAVFTRHT